MNSTGGPPAIQQVANQKAKEREDDMITITVRPYVPNQSAAVESVAWFLRQMSYLQVGEVTEGERFKTVKVTFDKKYFRDVKYFITQYRCDYVR